MNRREHVEWCKNRALEYVDRNELVDAIASMASDLSAHSETENYPAIGLGIVMELSGNLSTQQEMRKFINGFN